MTSRTHDLAAISALGAVVMFEPIRTFTLATALLAILANQVGGITPDIDQPTAPLWRNLPIGKFVGKFTDKALGGHRFITHSIVGLVLFGFLFKLLLQFLHPLMPHVNIGYVWWAFLIGFISHLIMDTFTKEGVPWLLPLPFKFGFPPIKAWRITTGKAIETLIIFPGLLALDVWYCVSHYQLLVYFVHHHLI